MKRNHDSLEVYNRKTRRIIKITTNISLFSLITSFIIFILKLPTLILSLVLGFALGSLISAINLSYTRREVDQIGRAAAKEKTNLTLAVFGTWWRLSTIFVGIFLALEYPDLFNLFSTVAALFVGQTVVIVEGIRNKEKV